MDSSPPPCFVDGVTTLMMTGRSSCLAAQPRSGHRDFNAVAAAAGAAGGVSVASSPQSWASCSGAFAVFLGIGAGANRHRSRRSKNYLGGRSIFSLQAFLTDDTMAEADATKYDYELEGNGEVSVPVCNVRSDDPATSLTAYMTQPVGAFALVPLPHGVSFDRVGLRRAANGCDEEFFCVQLPPIKFPGILSLDAVANTFVKGGPSELLIEGSELKLMGGLDDLDAVNESLLFFKNSSLTWSDEADHRELRLKTEVKVKFAPPRFFRLLVPKFLFKPMGTAAMKLVLRIVQNALAKAFAKDYEEWETDETFRIDRANALASASSM